MAKFYLSGTPTVGAESSAEGEEHSLGSSQFSSHGMELPTYNLGKNSLGSSILSVLQPNYATEARQKEGVPAPEPHSPRTQQQQAAGDWRDGRHPVPPGAMSLG